MKFCSVSAFLWNLIVSGSDDVSRQSDLDSSHSCSLPQRGEGWQAGKKYV